MRPGIRLTGRFALQTTQSRRRSHAKGGQAPWLQPDWRVRKQGYPPPPYICETKPMVFEELRSWITLNDKMLQRTNL